MSPELAWDCRCRLGEGAVWNAADGSLYFVDILGREVLAFTPGTGVGRRWTMPERIGWIVQRASGRWVAGFESGVVALRLGVAGHVHVEQLHRLHAEGSALRINDGKVDAAGRLWFGTLDAGDESRPDGCLYRWIGGSAPVEVDSGYCVTNGPTFSADGRTLFHTDSVPGVVYAYDVGADGALSGRREWLRFGAGEGHPDGMTTDAAGRLWIAHWDGARVTQRDAQGAVLRTVELPVPRVTTVAFGGPALTDLYITSARAGLDSAALAAAPQSGGLFVLRGVAAGRPPTAFSG